jgi:signal transduction histidine kinase/membrane protein implicated in regulation of membrane protease activity
LKEPALRNDIHEVDNARKQSESASREALNADLRDSFPALALILGALFTLLAISHAFVLPRDIASVMVSLAALTALLNFGVAWALRHRVLPSRWAHPLATADALLALFNSLLHLYLTADALQTTNVMLLIIGVGFIVFSTFWWGLIVGVATLGWLFVVWQIGPDPTWQHFGFAMVSAVAVSLLVHLVRRRTYIRLERFRSQDQEQRTKLERSLHTTERIQRALETTMDVAQHITAILNLEALLYQVTQRIKEHYGYTYVGIFLLDETGEFAVARAGTGKTGQMLCEQGYRLEVGREGIVGWVAEYRQIANVSDVTADPRYVPLPENPAIVSALALPLEAAGELLGVLDIESDARDSFGVEDVQILRALAAQVAVAIQNAYNYQAEQARRQITERLYTVGMALSRTLNLAETLDLILTGLVDIVAFDRGSVMLESSGELLVVASTGFPPGTQPLDVRVHIKENDVFQDLRRTQRPLLIADVQQRPDWEYVKNLPPARSWLGVPLVHQGEVIGMLSLTRERPEPYTEDEVAFSETFASQAAMAIQNALLYENLSSVNRELEKTVQQLSERTRDLQTAYLQLERLDRTKSDFIRVASHELRTPITVMSGYSQMLLDDPKLKKHEEYFPMISGIISGIARMETIVGSILDMAKIDSRVMQLHPEPLILSVLFQAIRTAFNQVCQERSLTITMKGLEGLPIIQADTEAMRKAFHHLLVNAVKYTPDGGTITVTGRPVSPGDAEFSDGGVEIVVSDTGIGIDPSAQQLIFTKFYQTGEVAIHSSGTTTFKGGGPGLGLAIARGVVEAHGGKIWAESPGYDEVACPGSHFHVILPLTAHELRYIDAPDKAASG